MMRVHFLGSTSGDLDAAPGTTTAFTSSREHWNLTGDIVTHDRVLWAIDSFDLYKILGMDGILPVLLQKGKTISVSDLQGMSHF